MKKYKCRYINDNNVCTVSGDYCTNCTKQYAYKYSYTAYYDPFKQVTSIAIVNERGRKYISADITGQLSEIAIKAYADDLTRILIDKGVLK